MTAYSKLRTLFVSRIYADHNRSRKVRSRVQSILSQLDECGRGLNVGSGLTRPHPRMVNLDLIRTAAVDCVGDAQKLPFRSGSFDVVLSQESLEHVPDPFLAMEEIARVMKPGATLYFQVPFIIGYHPGPTDYWRFTTEGITEIVRRTGLTIVEANTSVSGATGYYRVSVEFWATVFSLNAAPLYKFMKAAFAVLLAPIKWLDPIFELNNERHRIAGGYFVIATKPDRT